MKHSPWRCKKNAIRRIDARNIAKRADQWHRDMDAYIASQTRRIGASTVRRRDSDTIDISFTIADLEPLMTEQYEPYIATDLHIDMEISEMEMLVRDTTIKARGLTPDMLGVRPEGQTK